MSARSIALGFHLSLAGARSCSPFVSQLGFNPALRHFSAQSQTEFMIDRASSSTRRALSQSWTSLEPQSLPRQIAAIRC